MFIIGYTQNNFLVEGEKEKEKSVPLKMDIHNITTSDSINIS